MAGKSTIEFDEFSSHGWWHQRRVMFTWSTLQGATGESYSTWFYPDVYIYNIHVFHTFHHIFHSIYYVHCISKSTTFSSWYPLEPKVLTQLLIESLRFTSKAARLVVLGSMEVVLGLNRESTMTGGSKEDFLMTLVEFRKRSNPKNGHFKREQIRFSPTGDGCLIWGFPKVGVPPNHQF